MQEKPVHIGPEMRITHPDHGDITAEVAQELARLNQQETERVYRQAQKRQQHIARVCGQESRIGENGLRLVAQIDETVFNYWEQREGPEFWKHELKYMLKRHPELAVKAKSETLKTGYTGQPRVRGRGRWATA